MMVVALSIGGTMVMRKYHNATAVGFFMGAVCAMSQYFFWLFWIYLGFGEQRREYALPSRKEGLQASICVIESLLLASFAVLLGTHRSEIMTPRSSTIDTREQDDDYAPPLKADLSADFVSPEEGLSDDYNNMSSPR